MTRACHAGQAMAADDEQPTRTLLLLRHGQSTANAEDRFAGWLDVPLTVRGKREAVRAAQLMDEHSVVPSVVHSSVLIRATRTADIVLGTLRRPWVPIHRTWRLNERHYGALQGRRKSEVRASVTEETFQHWRRAYRGRPPAGDNQSDLALDPRYALLPLELDALPHSESLRDVQARLLPYWYEEIVPTLAASQVTLIVAHGSPLRALIMHLDQISESGIATVNVPTGIPLRYDLDEHLVPRTPGGVYLDPAAAIKGAAEVAAQGAMPAAPGDRRR